ncbi:hypothetical protein [Curtobacterium sp. USHLN213]|uniref:hypothetical protein n=1 Tax=Curtobacterium sp. USHLN213 TaxID=3081255 RepID=UPI003016F15B
MNVDIRVDVRAYLDGMREIERAMKKQRRRERAWNIIGVLLATTLVGYVLYSAWMKASGQW